METQLDLGKLVEELRIADIVSAPLTDEQTRVLERVYHAAKTRSIGGNGVSSVLYLALGVAGPFSRDSINTAAVNSTFENDLPQTNTPATGDVCAWHSNALLYIQNGFYTSTLRHLGVVLGSRDNVPYVAHQVVGNILIESVSDVTERVDSRARIDFRHEYKGVLAVKYHSLDNVLAKRADFLRR